MNVVVNAGEPRSTGEEASRRNKTLFVLQPGAVGQDTGVCLTDRPHAAPPTLSCPAVPTEIGPREVSTVLVVPEAEVLVSLSTGRADVRLVEAAPLICGTGSTGHRSEVSTVVGSVDGATVHAHRGTEGCVVLRLTAGVRTTDVRLQRATDLTAEAGSAAGLAGFATPIRRGDVPTVLALGLAELLGRLGLTGSGATDEGNLASTALSLAAIATDRRPGTTTVVYTGKEAAVLAVTPAELRVLFRHTARVGPADVGHLRSTELPGSTGATGNRAHLLTVVLSRDRPAVQAEPAAELLLVLRFTPRDGRTANVRLVQATFIPLGARTTLDRAALVTAVVRRDGATILAELDAKLSIALGDTLFVGATDVRRGETTRGALGTATTIRRPRLSAIVRTGERPTLLPVPGTEVRVRLGGAPGLTLRALVLTAVARGPVTVEETRRTGTERLVRTDLVGGARRRTARFVVGWVVGAATAQESQGSEPQKEPAERGARHVCSPFPPGGTGGVRTPRRRHGPETRGEIARYRFRHTRREARKGPTSNRGSSSDGDWIAGGRDVLGQTDEPYDLQRDVFDTRRRPGSRERGGGVRPQSTVQVSPL